jgi:thiol-disulfide isomerase/thioredoxin
MNSIKNYNDEDLQGPNIGYLEMTDIDAMGNLKSSVCGGKPVIIMFQASWCGHCKHAKPEFQKFADENSGKVVCLTVQEDEEKQKDICKKMMELLEIRGFPTFKWYVNGNYTEQSGRKKEDFEKSLKNFM